MPRQYREDVTPLGIVGGIKVEASPWVEDNLWVLETIANEPIIVGVVNDKDVAVSSGVAWGNPIKYDSGECISLFAPGGRHFAIFNLADSAVVGGVALICILTLKGIPMRGGTRAND